MAKVGVLVCLLMIGGVARPALADNTVAGPEGAAETVSARASVSSEDLGSRWSITAAGGPSLMFRIDPGPYASEVWRGGNRYEIEVQRRASPGGYIFGVALESGPGNGHDTPLHELGAAAFVGSGWRYRRAFLEATVGVGLESWRGVTRTATSTVSSTSTTGVVFERIDRWGDRTPMMYARGQATFGLAVSRSWDLVARLGGHAGTAGQISTYASATVGVRLRLP